MPYNWSTQKFHAATFKRVVAESKLKWYSELNSSLSNPKHRKELFCFMSNNTASWKFHVSRLSRTVSARKSWINLTYLHAAFPYLGGRTNDHSYSNFPVGDTELATALSSFEYSAFGLDGVTVSMLKLMGTDFTDPLISVLNTSIRSACIPRMWKLAIIILEPNIRAQNRQHSAYCSCSYLEPCEIGGESSAWQFGGFHCQ